MKNQIKNLIALYTNKIEQLESTIDEHSSHEESQRIDQKVRIWQQVINDLTELQG